MKNRINRIKSDEAKRKCQHKLFSIRENIFLGDKKRIKLWFTKGGNKNGSESLSFIHHCDLKIQRYKDIKKGYLLSFLLASKKVVKKFMKAVLLAVRGSILYVSIKEITNLNY